MYTKQQKSALTREINAMKRHIENVSECFAGQRPDRDGMVWYFGEKKHAEGYLNILNRELRRMEAKRYEMDIEQPVAVPVERPEKKNAEIVDFMVSNNVDLTDVLDAVILNNGIIGVGLITLGNELQQYVRGKIQHNPESVNV